MRVKKRRTKGETKPFPPRGKDSPEDTSEGGKEVATPHGGGARRSESGPCQGVGDHPPRSLLSWACGVWLSVRPGPAGVRCPELSAAGVG